MISYWVQIAVPVAAMAEPAAMLNMHRMVYADLERRAGGAQFVLVDRFWDPVPGNKYWRLLSLVGWTELPADAVAMRRLPWTPTRS